MISMIQDMIEKKIEAAQKNGEFDNLPGAGQPLDLSEDPFVPEGLRATYRILKNSGFKPAEVEMKVELEKLKIEISNREKLSEEEYSSLKKRILNLESSLAIALENLKKNNSP